MDGTSLRVEKSELGFFIPYVIYLTAYIFSMSFFYQYYIGYMKVLMAMPVLMLLVREIMRGKPDRKEVFAIILCSVLLLLELIARNASMLTMGCHVFFIYAARNIPFRKLAGWSAVIMSLAVFVVFLCSQLGVIANYTEYFRTFDRYREYLGFLYCLYPSVFYMNITMLFICFWKEKITFAGLFFLSVGAVFFFLRTDSRAAFAFTALVIVIALALKLLKPEEKKRSSRPLWILKWAFLICALISFLFVILYEAKVPVAVSLNRLLEFRIRYALRSLRHFGYGIWGVPVNWVGSGLSEFGLPETGRYLFVDNIYVHMLQFNGLVYSLIYLLLNTLALDKIYKKRDHYLLILSGLIAVYGLIDNLQENLFFCPFWFVLSTELLGGIRIRRRKGSKDFRQNNYTVSNPESRRVL